MRKTYEQILKLECPQFLILLGERFNVPPEKRWGITYEIQCDDGWYDLVRTACHKIEALNKQGANCECHQIKQKFGGLRIYTGQVHPDFNDRVNDIITEAMNLADKTCEMCSQEGKLHTDLSWWSTLCESCHTKRKEELRKRNEEYRQEQQKRQKKSESSS